MTERHTETTPRRLTRQTPLLQSRRERRVRAGVTGGATLLFAVLLGGCAALHSPVDERPTLRGGSSGESSGSSLSAQDQNDLRDEDSDESSDEDSGSGDDGDSEGNNQSGADGPQTRVRPVPTMTDRESPSRGSDSRPEDDPDDSPDFRIYRDGDRSMTCADLDGELAQLQGQSTSPTQEPNAAAEPTGSPGLISRVMDSSMLSGIRGTITGEPSDDEQRETAIRQRIEWLRELKAEKSCYATQPLF